MKAQRQGEKTPHVKACRRHHGLLTLALARSLTRSLSRGWRRHMPAARCAAYVPNAAPRRAEEHE